MNSWLSKLYGEEVPGSNPPEVKPVETPPKTFTQDEVNAMLAENKRNLKKQIEDLQKSSGDTKALQKKLQELNDQMLTKEELAKQEADKLKGTYEEQLKGAVESGTAWEGRYKSQLYDIEIARADRTHDLYDAEQFGLILKPMTETIPETDKEGKPTGGFKVMAKVEIDGKQLTLPLVEAIGKLREAGKFPNQFKIKGSPGTGVTLNNNPGPVVAGDVKPGDMQGFMKMFQKMKTEGKI